MEKIKGIIGVPERTTDMRDWLMAHGAGGVFNIEKFYKHVIYFVRPDKTVGELGVAYEYLFDMENLPKPRAAKNEYFYFVGSNCHVWRRRDTYIELDDDLYKAGNYFLNEEDAIKTSNAWKEILKQF